VPTDTPRYPLNTSANYPARTQPGRTSPGDLLQPDGRVFNRRVILLGQPRPTTRVAAISGARRTNLLQDPYASGGPFGHGTAMTASLPRFGNATAFHSLPHRRWSAKALDRASAPDPDCRAETGSDCWSAVAAGDPAASPIRYAENGASASKALKNEKPASFLPTQDFPVGDRRSSLSMAGMVPAAIGQCFVR